MRYLSHRLAFVVIASLVPVRRVTRQISFWLALIAITATSVSNSGCGGGSSASGPANYCFAFICRRLGTRWYKCDL
jgi:hypothetical protein